MVDNSTDRRGYPRVVIQLQDLKVEVGPLGTRSIRGVVLDISRSGTKVKLEKPIPELYLSGDYVVRFPDCEGRVSPEAVLARLNRVEDDRRYAVEFRKPLDKLEIKDDAPMPVSSEAETRKRRGSREPRG